MEGIIALLIPLSAVVGAFSLAAYRSHLKHSLKLGGAPGGRELAELRAKNAELTARIENLESIVVALDGPAPLKRLPDPNRAQ